MKELYYRKYNKKKNNAGKKLKYLKIYITLQNIFNNKIYFCIRYKKYYQSDFFFYLKILTLFRLINSID